MADNKGQHLINLLALLSVLKTRKKLGFNIKIIFEMVYSENIKKIDLRNMGHMRSIEINLSWYRAIEIEIEKEIEIEIEKSASF